ncbi:uncharacterized protein LOC129574844 isoform X2 [Sitodiplosis mosellana]|uniref:uncharacterized protein LOC129574844 isoform X2 n=1 Tax=Sitodiplosis mosellana TaxID=263140 RepID=UPI0024437F0D|nr:uncharacterized protein LOC129574844 isoform X2 [Sitodiplosis mosellana]
MTIQNVSQFLYRSSNIDEKYFEKILKQPLPFDNTEYELRISGSVETDTRLMSFIDVLWGFEVTGGFDQYEPLTVIDVRRSGYAFRAGIRKGDYIIRINKVYTDDMTLIEAQRLIRKSGKNLRIFVRGNDDPEEIDEFTVDFWFKPRKKFPPIHVVNKWPDAFNWNDRKKPIYKESNCFMVPSKAEEHHKEVLRNTRKPIIPTEDTANTVTEQLSPLAAAADKAEADAAAAAAANTQANTTDTITNGTPSVEEKLD